MHAQDNDLFPIYFVSHARKSQSLLDAYGSFLHLQCGFYFENWIKGKRSVYLTCVPKRPRAKATNILDKCG